MSTRDEAEKLVDHHIYSLGQSVSDLWKARLNPQTADLVLRDEGALWAALGSLRTLVDDIRAANDATKQAAE